MKTSEKETTVEEKQTEETRKGQKVLYWISTICLVLCSAAFVLELNSYLHLRRECAALRRETPTGIEWYEAETIADAVPIPEPLSNTSETTIVSSKPSKAPIKVDAVPSENVSYVLNTNSKKIHKSTCRYAQSMKEENKQIVSSEELDTFVKNDYSYCKVCCKDRS